ncbi:alpha-galactosidase [Streptomyces actinomycinicus]|uniref:Alpha-galactosidase n=1 Tax=Streptomyces actinomycinicus TaxID=1695166 RepID=A0A937ESJ9_9ACTN|nr:alpha-galactosidase [Streptomyces actinomycinicus]MBL1087690.1 alpha-galactosidase [Streptomyces actinomycinicus]
MNHAGRPYRPSRRSRLVGLGVVVSLLTVSVVAVALGDEEPASPVAPWAPTPGKELGATPQMGWNSWNAYRCAIDEKKIMAAADAIQSRGLDKLGYTYVNIDDCWQAGERDSRGRLRADPVRFPSGIAKLAQYVHDKGLKLGIYASPGKYTCAEIWDHYPGALGSSGHEEIDAATFAAWGVDYLKYDWCRADSENPKTSEYPKTKDFDARATFEKMRAALARTKRPVFYSMHREPQQPVESWRPQVANSWRTTPDIRDSWQSMIDIARRNWGWSKDEAGKWTPGDPEKGQDLARLAGPGHWNDPDMLEVGNGGMTTAEYRTHFSLWSEMAAPLIIGTDLAKASDDSVKILGNEDVIAVDQDAAGRQGRVVSGPDDVNRGVVVMAKELSDGSRAVTLTNTGPNAATISATTAQIGLDAASTYTVKDLWTGQTASTTGGLSAEVASHDTVMYRITPDGTTTSPVPSAPPPPSAPPALPVLPDPAAPGAPADSSAGSTAGGAADLRPAHDSCAAPAWERFTVYPSEGIVVSHAGRSWKSRWWTRNNEPGSPTAYGAWADLGVC